MKNLQLDVTKKITPNHPNDYYISCRCCPNVDNRQTRSRSVFTGWEIKQYRVATPSDCTIYCTTDLRCEGEEMYH